MINYLKGDATKPQVVDGDRLIVHICNNRGGWGRGFVVAISNRWKEPEQEYRKNISEMRLGDIQIVQVEERLYVVNMIAQNGFRNMSNPVPLSYKALEKCMEKLKDELRNYNNPSLHMPRIGCGLAGGKWFEVVKLINITENIYVYDLDD